MSNPLIDRIARRGSMDHGGKAEARLAKRQKALLTPASGAMAGAKGDMVLGEIRLEAKATSNDTLSLKYEWLKKIAAEASEHGQVPALAVQFVMPDGRPRQNGSWVLVREVDFEALKVTL